EQVVDAEGDPQHDPLYASVCTPNLLRVDLGRRRIQRTVVVVELLSADRHLPPPERSLPAAEAVDIGRERLDRDGVEALAPRGHLAVAGVGDRINEIVD